MARQRAPGWDPAQGWGQTPGWAPVFDDDPLPLRATRARGRWLWPAVAVSGFLAVVSYVFGHDDPQPGLSNRGLLTVAVAAVVLGLLTIRRAAGPGPLARAVAEYTVVALLAGLLATTGIAAGQPAAGAKQASAARDSRPTIVKTVDGARDWLAAWWQWATQEYDRRTRASSTTSPEPKDEAMAPSPALLSSTRRPL